MQKKILMISTSPRKGGNSEKLADAFGQGAQAQGHAVEKVCLSEQKLLFCQGCLACQKTGQCMLQDDVAALLTKMAASDVIVFATPIYFYEMSGQMKTLLDRTNPLFPREYAFRDIYLLAAAADADEAAMDGALQGLQGWIACFEQTRLKGIVRGVGVTEMGAIQKLPHLLDEAYQLGSQV